QLDASQSLSLLAGHDLDILGSDLNAGQSLSLGALNDLKIGSLSLSDSQHRSGSLPNGSWQLDLANTWQRGSQLQSGGSLNLQAHRDLTLQGTQLQAQGQASLLAGRDLSLGSVMESHDSRQQSQVAKKRLFGGFRNDDLSERHTTEQLGSLLSAGNLSLQAGRDLTLQAAALSSRQDLAILAGRHLALTSATETEQAIEQHQSSRSGFQLDFSIKNHGISYNRQQASSDQQQSGQTQRVTTLTAGANLALSAGDQATLVGAQLKAGQDLALIAKQIELIETHDLQQRHDQRESKSTGLGINQGALNSAMVSQLRETHKLGAPSRKDASLKHKGDLARRDLDRMESGHAAGLEALSKNGYMRQHTQSISDSAQDNTRGSQLLAGGELTIQATGGDLNLRGARISSEQGSVTLAAAGNLNLDTALSRQQKRNDTGEVNTGGLQHRRQETEQTGQQQQHQLTRLTGQRIQLAAKQDLNLRGVEAVAEGALTAVAGGRLTVSAVNDRQQETANQSDITKGNFRSGRTSTTIGRQAQHNDQQAQSDTSQASALASLTDRLTLQAGQAVDITGSDLIGKTGISIEGRQINVQAAEAQNQSQQHQRSSQGGLSLGLRGSIVDALTTILDATERSNQSDDKRLQALYAYRAANTAYQGMQMLAQKGADIRVQVTVGGKSQRQDSTRDQTELRGSRLHSEGDIQLSAHQGDLTLRGSEVKGQQIALQASGDLKLEGQARQDILRSKSQSQGGEIGVAVTIGQSGNSAGILLSAEAARGRENGDLIGYQNSHLNAGQTLSLKSGGDTTLSGAVAKGQRIEADIGGNLTLQSLQDRDDYQNRQQSGGGTMVVGIGFSGSASYSQSRINSRYLGVGEQTALQAGRGGFDLQVGQHTQLNGAVISSEADANRNRLSTGTLGWQDLQNQAHYQGDSFGVAVSYDSNKAGQNKESGQKPSQNTGNGPSAPQKQQSPGSGGMTLGFTSDSRSSTTQSAISAG
ncbi:hypothetical protein HNQ59_003957, partial [Chitinivorax tropicus]